MRLQTACAEAGAILRKYLLFGKDRLLETFAGAAVEDSIRFRRSARAPSPHRRPRRHRRRGEPTQRLPVPRDREFTEIVVVPRSDQWNGRRFHSANCRCNGTPAPGFGAQQRACDLSFPSEIADRHDGGVDGRFPAVHIAYRLNQHARIDHPATFWTPSLYSAARRRSRLIPCQAHNGPSRAYIKPGRPNSIPTRVHATPTEINPTNT